MRAKRSVVAGLLAAGVASVSLLAAGPASAGVAQVNCAVSGTVVIHNGWKADQCFYYDLVASSGHNIIVNDWYDWVYAGSYSINTTWRDVSTGKIYPENVGPNGYATQPESNAVLFNVIFQ